MVKMWRGLSDRHLLFLVYEGSKGFLRKARQFVHETGSRPSFATINYPLTILDYPDDKLRFSFECRSNVSIKG